MFTFIEFNIISKIEKKSKPVSPWSKKTENKTAEYFLITRRVARSPGPLKIWSSLGRGANFHYFGCLLVGWLLGANLEQFWDHFETKLASNGLKWRFKTCFNKNPRPNSNKKLFAGQEAPGKADPCALVSQETVIQAAVEAPFEILAESWTRCEIVATKAQWVAEHGW